MKQLIIASAFLFSMALITTAGPVPIAKPLPVNNDGSGNELKVYANPKTGNALVSFTSNRIGKGMIVVMNEAGSAVIKQPVKLAEGKNKINVNNFTSLEEGYYTVYLHTHHEMYSTQFLLWK